MDNNHNNIPFLIIGNWKLNGYSKMLSKYFNTLIKNIKNIKSCTISVAPPSIYLYQIKSFIKNNNIYLSSQNVDIHNNGSFTGEISAKMLKDIGIKYCIIGHYERRYFHKEDDTNIAIKFNILKHEKIIPILCIGENKTEYLNKQSQNVCIKQINSILNYIGDNAFENTILAYEPIWSIGTGITCDPLEVQRMNIFIKNYLYNINSNNIKNFSIIYGGSINIHNIYNFAILPEINGVLIGKESNSITSFIKIIKKINSIKLK